MLPPAKQCAIAGELDHSVGEVLKKLEQLRVTASGFSEARPFLTDLRIVSFCMQLLLLLPCNPTTQTVPYNTTLSKNAPFICPMT